MARALLILANTAVRNKAMAWVRDAPEGTRVEFKGPKRTLDQNSRLWANLTDIATQASHNGRKYTPDAWKSLFLHACGREIQFVPALDGSGFIPFNNSSSDLSREEMSDLLEFMEAWAFENKVTFHYSGPREAAQPVSEASGSSDSLEVETPASAALEGSKPETPLDRGLRLLLQCKTAEDVNDLHASIRDELDKASQLTWDLKSSLRQGEIAQAGK